MTTPAQVFSSPPQGSAVHQPGRQIVGVNGLPRTFAACKSIADFRAMSRAHLFSALGPLTKDAEELFDAAVVRVGLDRLRVVSDTLSAGLTFPVDNPLASMVVTWERESRSGNARRTMLPGIAVDPDGITDRNQASLPLYATTAFCSLNIRTLQAALTNGQALDTTLVENKTRNANELIEDQAVNGAGQINGLSVPGLLNAPNVNTTTWGGSVSWTDAAKTGADIVDDVKSMISGLQLVNRFGPYRLWVNGPYWLCINTLDYSAAKGDNTILQRLQSIEDLTIGVADKLPAERAVMVEMNSDVLDVINGQSPTVITWASPNSMEFFWMVMAFIVLRVRDDYDGNSGIITGNV